MTKYVRPTARNLCVGWLADAYDRYPKALANVYGFAQCGPGWMKIVEPLIAMAEKKGFPVCQIKEKFGALRFYLDESDSEMNEAVSAAESASRSICEGCGCGSQIRDRNGWLCTHCDDCYKRIR